MTPSPPRPLHPRQRQALGERGWDLCRRAREAAERQDWTAAVLLAAAGAEAVLVPALKTCERRLRAAGSWPARRGGPTEWALCDLLDVAQRAGWFPASTTRRSRLENFLALIDDVRALTTDPRAWVCLPTARRRRLDDVDLAQRTFEVLTSTFAAANKAATGDWVAGPGGAGPGSVLGGGEQ